MPESTTDSPGRVAASRGALSRAAQRTPWLKGLPREVRVLAAIAFFVALGFGIVIPTIPVFAKSFGVSAFLAVAVVSVFALMRLVGAPLAGGLVNRLGERWVLSSGLIIVAVSSALAGFSQAYLQLLILRGIGGLGSAMFTVSALALLLRTAGPTQRGRAASAFQAGFLFGAIAGPAVGALVVAISIRAPFFFYAATLALATVVALLYLHTPEQIEAQAAAEAARVNQPDEADAGTRSQNSANEKPTTHAAANEATSSTETAAQEWTNQDAASQSTSDEGSRRATADDKSASENSDEESGEEPADDPVVVVHDHGSPTPRTLGQALKSRAYRAALAANLTNGWVTFGLRATMIPLFVTEALHRSISVVSVAVLVGAVFQAIALVPAGRISDHSGRRPAMIIGTIGTLAGMVVLALTDSLALFLISMAVLGVGSAFLGSAPAAVVGDVVGNQRGGTVVAIYQMISDVGAIIGPLLAGLVLDSYGFGWAFSTGVAISVIALVFTVAMPETRATVNPSPP